MGLKDQITEDMKVAMRAKDAPRLLTIRSLLAALKQKEVDERIVLDDATIISIIDKLIKQRRDSITQFTAGQRPDLVEQETAELNILTSYLPARLSPDEVLAKVKQIVQEIGAQGPADMGKAMAAAKAQLAGLADMGSVSAAVKQALAS